MTCKTTFIVRTAAGAPIRTFDDADMALRFGRARVNRETYPGLTVESETTVVTVRRMFTDKQGASRLQLVAGGAR